MLGLDLSSTDYTILSYLSYFSELLPIDKAYALHVNPGLELPAYAKHALEEEKFVPLDEQIKELMQDRITKKLGKPDFAVDIDVQEGDVTEQMLHWARVKQIDLTLVGQKAIHLGSGLAAKKLARRSETDILFVPELNTPVLQTILVPTDFSDDATYALEKAIALAREKQGQIKVHLLHVYEVPSNVHFELYRTKEQYESLFRDNVTAYCAQYLAGMDTEGVELETHFVQKSGLQSARQVIDVADAIDADLIMLGANGHSPVYSFLLGSFTEKLLSYNEGYPIWVLRKPETQARLQEKTQQAGAVRS